MNKLWGGRFAGSTDDLAEELGRSIAFDSRLAHCDVRASVAHARMLGACGIVSREDADRIVAGLESIGQDLDAGTFAVDANVEDIHTNIEAALVVRIGEAGKRLHTARSRNDQIATDVRLWLRDHLDSVVESLRDVQRALLGLAENHVDTLLPGFTHLQPAQPVVLAHHLHAYMEMFERDIQRIVQVRRETNVMPLGSAALAGTPYPIDRDMVARELGFDAVSANSMDAVSDRDFMVSYASAAALVMVHMSRLCEELIVWTTPRFGFARIGEAFTTGSSIMPQKRNPDMCELIRGKSGRVFGSLQGLLTVLKGLPLTYNRDLQEDKEPVFDIADTLSLCVPVMARMVASVVVNESAMAQALEQGFLEATDLADYLTEKGEPFRNAHEIVGRIVRYCEEKGRTLKSLSIDELRMFCPLFEADAHLAIDGAAMVARRNHAGGTAPDRVREALARYRNKLAAGEMRKATSEARV